MSFKHRLYRLANSSGNLCRKGTDKLIGDGKSTKGVLNNVKDAYLAGTRGILYEEVKEPVTDKHLQSRMRQIFYDA